MPVQSDTAQSDIDTADATNYCYSPLRRGHIRLLQLRVSSPSTDVEAELIHIPLHVAQARKYVALSYTWGAPEHFGRIKVNDRPMQIRMNVLGILNRLRVLAVNLIWVGYRGYF